MTCAGFMVAHRCSCVSKVEGPVQEWSQLSGCQQFGNDLQVSAPWFRQHALATQQRLSGLVIATANEDVAAARSQQRLHDRVRLETCTIQNHVKLPNMVGQPT